MNELSHSSVLSVRAAPSKAVEAVRVVPITPSSVRVQWAPLGDAHWSGDARTGGYRVTYQLADYPAPAALATALARDVPAVK
ncbi:unnamed protein product, partial [Leptidea sinapis]